MFFQELNQDSYYIHDIHIEQPATFDLDFWRVLFYLLTVRDDFSDVFRLANQDNNIQIMFTFVQKIGHLRHKLPEPPLFYWLLSFLSGKNLTQLIQQMNISQSTGRQLFEACSQYTQQYLDVYNQVDMAVFVLDLFDRLDFGLPDKGSLYLEEDGLAANLLVARDYMLAQNRIFQLPVESLVPSNIFALYQESPDTYSLANSDILAALSHPAGLDNIRPIPTEYNPGLFERLTALPCQRASQMIGSQYNSNPYNSNPYTSFAPFHVETMVDSRDNHYKYLNYFNSNDLASSASSHQHTSIVSPAKAKAVSVINPNEMTNTNHLKLERNQGMLKLRLIWGKRVYLYGHPFTHEDKAAPLTAKQRENNLPFIPNQVVASRSNAFDESAFQGRYLESYQSNRQLRIFRDEDMMASMVTQGKESKPLGQIMQALSEHRVRPGGYVVHSVSNRVQKHYTQKKGKQNMLNFLIPSIKKNIHQQFENKRKRDTTSKKKYTTNSNIPGLLDRHQ